MSVKLFTTPAGEELAIMPAAEYEDLRDAITFGRIAADYRAGRLEALDSEEMRALLAAPTPLAFWRQKRGLTQAALAKAAGATQPHIAELETGKRSGSLELMARIAAALAITVDELVVTREVS